MHQGSILRKARGVLLTVVVADPRCRLHDVSRLGTIDPSRPRTVMSTGRQLRGKLTHVPDVPLIVLRVPVERVLFGRTRKRDLVANLDRHDSIDRLGVVGHVHRVELCLLLEVSLVGEPRPRRQREIRVVDLRGVVKVSRAEGRADRPIGRPGGSHRCLRQQAQHQPAEDEQTKRAKAHADLLFSPMDVAGLVRS